MAHTNETANYELSQFLGTDKPAWLVDYNGDMLKIDTALKNNADAEAASAEDIQELQDAIGSEGLTGRITDIENDVSDIKTEIGNIELPTVAQSLTGAIAELKGVNDDQNTAIGNNATAIAQVGGAVEGVSQLAYTIANVYDSSATYAVGDYAIYQNTLYKCTTAINVGETFDPTKWTSVKVMSEVDDVSQLAFTIANVYDSSATYAVGDYAIYQNTLYKCTTAINVGEPFDPTKWTSVKVMSEVGQGGGSGLIDVNVGTLSSSNVTETFTITQSSNDYALVTCYIPSLSTGDKQFPLVTPAITFLQFYQNTITIIRDDPTHFANLPLHVLLMPIS